MATIIRTSWTPVRQFEDETSSQGYLLDGSVEGFEKKNETKGQKPILAFTIINVAVCLATIGAVGFLMNSPRNCAVGLQDSKKP